MRITVINGTEIKGCTFQIKESFLEELRNENDVFEFVLPKDQPDFCIGCKNCFLKGEEYCPHYEKVPSIWKKMIESDLIVFVYPVYALRAPSQVKALLDHLCYNWVIHRPNKDFFNKEIAIITQSIGAQNGAARKEVETSMNWMGNSNIRKLGFGLIEGIIWEELSEERKNKIRLRTKKFSEYCKQPRTPKQGKKGKILFRLGKTLRNNNIKKEKELSLDSRYWLEQGWIKEKN